MVFEPSMEHDGSPARRWPSWSRRRHRSTRPSPDRAQSESLYVVESFLWTSCANKPRAFEGPTDLSTTMLHHRHDRASGKTILLQWVNVIWLGRLDSNQGMAESKSAALPLGYAPSRHASADGVLVKASRRRADHTGRTHRDQSVASHHSRRANGCAHGADNGIERGIDELAIAACAPPRPGPC